VALPVFFVKITTVIVIMWATTVLFKDTAQSKQWPGGRKFAESGHPVMLARNLVGDQNARHRSVTRRERLLCNWSNLFKCWGATVAQRKSDQKINDIPKIPGSRCWW
jgi:hypothetical protein